MYSSNCNNNNSNYSPAPNKPAEFKLDHSSNTKPKKRPNMQLWQFLLHLLNSNEFEATIEWSSRESAEFLLLDPEEVNISNLALHFFLLIA